MEFSNSNLLDTTFGMGDCATPPCDGVVPFQPWDPYEAEVALKRGTIFLLWTFPLWGRGAFSNVFGNRNALSGASRPFLLCCLSFICI